MKSRKTYLLFALVLIVALAAGVLYNGYYRSQVSQASEGPRMLAPENEESDSKAGPTQPVTFDIQGPFTEKSTPPGQLNKDLRSLPQVGPADKKPMKEMPSVDAGKSSGGPDPVAQTSEGAALMPATTASFKGLDLQNWGAGWPPDTNGDVSPSNYIQTVNTSIAIFDKSGNRLAAFTYDNFFGGTGTPCDASNQGDPVVVYDRVSGRWIITDFAWSSSRGPWYECIAVSKTADPVSGGWYFYGLVASTTSMNDYPKLGVWSDGIYMTANMFRHAKSFSGAKVWALNRSDLISGAPLRTVSFQLGNGYPSLIPGNFLGTAPAAGEPAFFMSMYAPSTLRLWKFHVDWANTSASTFTGPANLTVASFTRPSSNVPQLGSSETLDTLGDRLMVQLQYRNVNGVESLWTNHTVVSNGVTGVRWYEIRNPNGSPSVYQQSTFQPDSNYRWMGSLGVDKLGDLAIGYSVSSSSMYPAIRYAGRLVTDPLGQLGQAESTIIAGTGSQSGGYNRWGDYSGMSVDPADDCTFWYTTEYYETTGNDWQTRIASFKYPTCTP